MHIYTTGIIHHCNHSITYTNEIGYVHDYPLAPLTLLICPFPLTWNPPCCDRIRPPLSRVARKLTPLISLTCPCGPSPEIPTPWGFSSPKYTFIRTTLRTQPICLLTIHPNRRNKTAGCIAQIERMNLLVKGTVARDFRPLAFFMSRTHLVP